MSGSIPKDGIFSEKILVLFPLPKKCAAFYPKICILKFPVLRHCTEVRFTSFFSGGFITAIVVNPPERRLAKHISVQWLVWDYYPGVNIKQIIQGYSVIANHISTNFRSSKSKLFNFYL